MTPVSPPSLFDLENRLDFHRDILRQGSHAADHHHDKAEDKEVHAHVIVGRVDRRVHHARQPRDRSRNNLLIALLTLGEGWHNNHHQYAVSARQGFFWWEIDITYYLLKVFSWLGIVWDLRGLPQGLRDPNGVVADVR